MITSTLKELRDRMAEQCGADPDAFIRGWEEGIHAFYSTLKEENEKLREMLNNPTALNDAINARDAANFSQYLCKEKLEEAEKELEFANTQWHLMERHRDRLVDKIAELKTAVLKLRHAQKTYMANRGNDELGKKVAEAAEEVDKLL